jgi:hypothetical protein
VKQTKFALMTGKHGSFQAYQRATTPGLQ